MRELLGAFDEVDQDERQSGSRRSGQGLLKPEAFEWRDLLTRLRIDSGAAR